MFFVLARQKIENALNMRKAYGNARYGGYCVPITKEILIRLKRTSQTKTDIKINFVAVRVRLSENGADATMPRLIYWNKGDRE